MLMQASGASAAAAAHSALSSSKEDRSYLYDAFSKIPEIQSTAEGAARFERTASKESLISTNRVAYELFLEFDRVLSDVLIPSLFQNWRAVEQGQDPYTLQTALYDEGGPFDPFLSGENGRRWLEAMKKETKLEDPSLLHTIQRKDLMRAVKRIAQTKTEVAKKTKVTSLTDGWPITLVPSFSWRFLRALEAWPSLPPQSAGALQRRVAAQQGSRRKGDGEETAQLGRAETDTATKTQEGEAAAPATAMTASQQAEGQGQQSSQQEQTLFALGKTTEIFKLALSEVLMPRLNANWLAMGRGHAASKLVTVVASQDSSPQSNNHESFFRTLLGGEWLSALSKAAGVSSASSLHSRAKNDLLSDARKLLASLEAGEHEYECRPGIIRELCEAAFPRFTKLFIEALDDEGAPKNVPPTASVSSKDHNIGSVMKKANRKVKAAVGAASQQKGAAAVGSRSKRSIGSSSKKRSPSSGSSGSTSNSGKTTSATTATANPIVTDPFVEAEIR
jgi:hypothetical protein